MKLGYSFFTPHRLSFQQPPEAPKQTAEQLMSPEEAQTEVDMAKGRYLTLDASVNSSIIEKRGTDVFRNWIKWLSAARDSVKTVRDSKYQRLLSLLPQNERKLVGKDPEKIVLTSASWKKTMDDLMGIEMKLLNYDRIQWSNDSNNPQRADFVYVGSLDRAVALVKDMPPATAGEFLRNYINLRQNLGIMQREGSLNQTQVDAYLKAGDVDPAEANQKLMFGDQEKDKKEAEKIIG